MGDGTLEEIDSILGGLGEDSETDDGSSGDETLSTEDIASLLDGEPPSGSPSSTIDDDAISTLQSTISSEPTPQPTYTPPPSPRPSTGRTVSSKPRRALRININRRNLQAILDVPLEVVVEIGRTTKLLKEILALGEGSIVELEKLASEPVDIRVNDKVIGKGEVIVIDENFGVRVKEIVEPSERF